MVIVRQFNFNSARIDARMITNGFWRVLPQFNYNTDIK